jgi:hypothetical protein
MATEHDAAKQLHSDLFLRAITFDDGIGCRPRPMLQLRSTFCCSTTRRAVEPLLRLLDCQGITESTHWKVHA